MEKIKLEESITIINSGLANTFINTNMIKPEEAKDYVNDTNKAVPDILSKILDDKKFQINLKYYKYLKKRLNQEAQFFEDT